MLERGQHLQHDPRPAVVPHQANPPRLAFEVAQTAADLDAELAQQLLAHRQVIDAGRNAHRVQLRQLMALGRDVAQAQGGQPGLQGLVVPDVAGKACFQPFLVAPAAAPRAERKSS